MENTFLENIIFFFAAIDPIGTIPIFIAVTVTLTKKEKISVAFRSTIVAAIVLILFIITGELTLQAVDIPLSAFQVAGGIILFLFALSMVFGDAKPESELKSLNSIKQTAVFPLAIPSIASPGAMLAAVILTEKDRYDIEEQIITTFSMLIVLIITFLFMLIASLLTHGISAQGAAVMSRIMGILLASLAVTHVLNGIKTFFA